MEHLLNCHGEWTLALQCAAALPFVGPFVAFWIRALVVRFKTPHVHKEER